MIEPTIQICQLMLDEASSASVLKLVVGDAIAGKEWRWFETASVSVTAGGEKILSCADLKQKDVVNSGREYFS